MGNHPLNHLIILSQLHQSKTDIQSQLDRPCDNCNVCSLQINRDQTKVIIIFILTTLISKPFFKCGFDVTVIAVNTYKSLSREAETSIFQRIIWQNIGATCGVTVCMSAFLVCHQCYCAGSSLAWGLNLRAVVCGIF